MRNNIIAIIAVLFVTVGALWGIGNLLNPAQQEPVDVEGILLVVQNGAFNGTNPDIRVSLNVPKKLVVLNEDAVTHDLRIEDDSANILNINTAPLRPGQHFNAAVLAYHAGTYEYFCWYHPEMRGSIIAQ